MKPKGFREIWEEEGERSSPLELLTESQSLKLRIARRAGVDPEELERLEAEGLLDKRLSLRLYALSLQAIDALMDEIASGNASPEVLSKLALDAPKVAQRLAGRDVHKHIVLTADYWETVLRQSGEEDKDAGQVFY